MPRKINKLTCGIAIRTLVFALILVAPCGAQQLANDKLSLTVNANHGTYQLAVRGAQPIFTSRVAAQVNHEWLRSTEYPRHTVSESQFTDDLGSGRTITLTTYGLRDKADLIFRDPALRSSPLCRSTGDHTNTTERQSRCNRSARWN